MESIIHPLLQYALLAVGLGLSAVLFLTLKQDIQKVRNRSMEHVQALEKTVSQLKAEIRELNYNLAEVERKAGELPQLAPPKPAMNTTRRSQILRMHRRGERAEQIAAALGVPQGEVDLLLKVHQVALTA